MYCDGCGTAFNPGTRYCGACGKQLVTGPLAPAWQAPAAGLAPMVARPAGDGRVGRNANILAGFWLANGILRLMEVSWMLVFHRLFFSMGDWGNFGFPFVNRFGLGRFVWDGMFVGGLFFAFFGLIHLLLAWGLYQRQPWARVLGIVVGVLALIRIPFGTALGIYTLWVLLPESSGREFDAMVGAGGQVNSARYSA